MHPDLFEAYAQIFADIKLYNAIGPGPDWDGHQRTRYVQRALRLIGVSDETLREIMERGDDLATK